MWPNVCNLVFSAGLLASMVLVPARLSSHTGMLDCRFYELMIEFGGIACVCRACWFMRAWAQRFVVHCVLGQDSSLPPSVQKTPRTNMEASLWGVRCLRFWRPWPIDGRECHDRVVDGGIESAIDAQVTPRLFRHTSFVDICLFELWSPRTCCPIGSLSRWPPLYCILYGASEQVVYCMLCFDHVCRGIEGW